MSFGKNAAANIVTVERALASHSGTHSGAGAQMESSQIKDNA